MLSITNSLRHLFPFNYGLTVVIVNAVVACCVQALFGLDLRRRLLASHGALGALNVIRHQ